MPPGQHTFACRPCYDLTYESYRARVNRLAAYLPCLASLSISTVAIIRTKIEAA